MILFDADKCVSCNSCIRACPVPEANKAVTIGGRTIFDIDPEKCIRCGACVKECSHGARTYEDDTQRFWQDMKSGEKIVLLVAPSIKVAFDGCWRVVLDFLRKNGASAVYDVSYGADLCTWAHLRFIEKNPGRKLISQPCPAIVNYILKYLPEALDSLSPVQSPILCGAVYLRKYLGVTAKIAALTPCIAKRDEFRMTGIVDYNVTFEHLGELLESKGLRLEDQKGKRSAFEFDGTPGIMGAIYPRPGGLKACLELEAPQLSVISSEGTDHIYRELAQYPDVSPRDLPDVFDVLSCGRGCGSGPAVGTPLSVYRMSGILNGIEKYNRRSRVKFDRRGRDKQFLDFDKRLNYEDFLRTYTSQAVERLEVTDEQIDDVLHQLGKHTPTEMNYNCHACGFATCRELAKAIRDEHPKLLRAVHPAPSRPPPHADRADQRQHKRDNGSAQHNGGKAHRQHIQRDGSHRRHNAAELPERPRRRGAFRGDNRASDPHGEHQQLHGGDKQQRDRLLQNDP